MASIHPFSPYIFISGNQPFMSHSVTLLWFAQHTLATNHTSDGFFLVNKKKDSVFVTPSLHFGCMEGAVNAKGRTTNLQITTCDVQHLLPRQVVLKVSNAHQRQRLVWATKQYFAIVHICSNSVILQFVDFSLQIPQVNELYAANVTIMWALGSSCSSKSDRVEQCPIPDESFPT